MRSQTAVLQGCIARHYLCVLSHLNLNYSLCRHRHRSLSAAWECIRRARRNESDLSHCRVIEVITKRIATPVQFVTHRGNGQSYPTSLYSHEFEFRDQYRDGTELSFAEIRNAVEEFRRGECGRKRKDTASGIQAENGGRHGQAKTNAAG